MKICVIIPVHNESQNIGGLVEQLRSENLDVVVIDDGSKDGSGQIAKTKGAVVITHAQKKGKGASLRDGFEYAVKQNYDGVVVMDGDGQHDVADVGQFIAKAKEKKADVVVGTRMGNPKGMPWLRLWVNWSMSMLLSKVCGQRIPDTQCGFRFVSTEALRAVNLSSNDFEIESELLVQASKKGFTIESVPIRTIYRNELSKINPLLDTVRFFAYLLRAARD